MTLALRLCKYLEMDTARGREGTGWRCRTQCSARMGKECKEDAQEGWDRILPPLEAVSASVCPVTIS